jgi:hypothetical protein
MIAAQPRPEAAEHVAARRPATVPPEPVPLEGRGAQAHDPAAILGQTPASSVPSDQLATGSDLASERGVDSASRPVAWRSR